MSFGVVAIDVRSATLDLHRQLRGTAAKFSPHVTILPRAPRLDVERLCDALRDWAGRLTSSPTIELRGPRWISSDLAWYECEEGCDGRAWLEDAHRAALARMARTSPTTTLDRRHVGERYRPHMTVLWHCEIGRRPDLPDRLRVTPVDLTLYTYASEPRHGPVSRHRLAALH